MLRSELYILQTAIPSQSPDNSTSYLFFRVCPPSIEAVAAGDFSLFDPLPEFIGRPISGLPIAMVVPIRTEPKNPCAIGLLAGYWSLDILKRLDPGIIVSQA